LTVALEGETFVSKKKDLELRIVGGAPRSARKNVEEGSGDQEGMPLKNVGRKEELNGARKPFETALRISTKTEKKLYEIIFGKRPAKNNAGGGI